jgi:hypothetical protein
MMTELKSEVKVIVKRPLSELDNINMIPTANWLITTAYIAAEKNSLFVGGAYKPTFLNIQQVLAAGPRAEDVKVGDWVYIDMSRFIKTVKKKSTIRAGIGGEDMVSEQLVPPVWAAPGSETTYFKLSDREIEGIVVDPYMLNVEYQTIEEFMAFQDAMQKEGNAVKAKKDFEHGEAGYASLDLSKQPKGPMIRTSTSPKLIT